MAIFRRDPSNRGFDAGGVGKNHDLSQYLASMSAVYAVTGMCYQHGVALIAGSKRRSLLMAGDDNEMFMKRSLNVTPKTTEQHLIVRSDKSVAYVTNNKRLGA